ncbi:MAG: 5'-3' exonuclease H3TH domain-containing protein [Aliidongia sp.]
MEDYEADDLIATYTRHAVEQGATVTIVSSDKDLMQLVGPGVTMYDPLKQRTIGRTRCARVRRRPEKVIDVQALCGDSVDNVLACRASAVKTAAELINTYGDLETLLARAEEIKQPKRRQSLIDLRRRRGCRGPWSNSRRMCRWPCPLSDLVLRKPDHDKLMTFLREQGFRSLLNRIQTRQLRSEAVTPITGPAPLPVQPSAENAGPALRIGSGRGEPGSLDC